MERPHVQDSAPSTTVQTRTTAAQRFDAVVAQLPFMAYVLWMLYKQRFALVASGIAPGPDMLIASIGILLVFTPWIFTRERTGRIVGALVASAIMTLVMYADILYFRQFGDLVSVASLRFVSQLGSVKESVTHLMRPSDLLLWLDLPLISLLLLAPRRATGGVVRALGTGKLRARSATIITVVGAAIITAVALIDPYLSAKYYGHSMVASRMGLMNYHVFDIGNYIGRLSSRLAPSGEAVAQVGSYLEPQRPANGSPLFGTAKGKNVIMIQVESLQAFALGLKVDGQEVTPHMNRLARESMNFTDFYTQTGQGVTSDADLLANCSLHPTRTGAVYYDYAGNNFRCTPELLREQGYRAVAMQGMPADFWNLAAVYPNVGFERYYSLKDGFVIDEKIGIGLSDRSFLKQAVPHLKSLKEPYYAFVVTLTSHGPFDFEGLPRTLKLGALEGTDAGHYLHAVHYTDSAIGQFLDQLRADGTLDNSVVLLYGDHAGIFRQNTGMASLLGIPASDEVGWTRAEKRIPFMIRLPGGAEAGERPHAAGQVDIAPTLTALLGVPADDAYFMGRNLLEKPQGVVAFYNGSAMTDQHLFWSKDPNPALGKCYERKSGGEVAIDECVPTASDAAERLRISQMIVARDLIPQLMKRR